MKYYSNNNFNMNKNKHAYAYECTMIVRLFRKSGLKITDF